MRKDILYKPWEPIKPDELETAGLYFLEPGTTMNGQMYLQLFQDKLFTCTYMVHHDSEQRKGKNILRRSRSLHWNSLVKAMTSIQQKIYRQTASQCQGCYRCYQGCLILDFSRIFQSHSQHASLKWSSM